MKRFVSPYPSAIGVFVCFAITFLVLRTHQYVAVDGALRCLEVYHRQELFFHANNHLWYPANIFLWSQALSWFGLKAGTPVEFIELSQALNAVAAAACLGAVYILLWIATSSARLSLLAVTAYGFSRAFLLHATNSAEPVVGLCYSALAILLVVEALRRNKTWLLPFAGGCLGMAMASYQSMVLITPLAVLLGFGWSDADGKKGSLSSRLMRVARIFVGQFVAVVGTYGWAYWKSGETNVRGMIHRFLELQGGKEVYGSFSIAKVVNSPFGLVSALLPALPPDYVGVRSLLRHNFLWIACVASVLIWLACMCWLLARALIARWGGLDPRQRGLIFALLVSLLILIGPLLYWDPLYDKLWLQPLGVIIVLAGVLYRIGSLRRGPVITVILFSFLEAGTNLRWAIPAHINPTKGANEMASVAQIVKPQDFIVLNFDPISTLYLGFWASPQNTLLLPASTRAQALNWLADAETHTRESGGAVYFLSVFDETEQSWAEFLGKRVGIPYHAFDDYRSRSRIVQSFQVDGHTITLRKLPG
jgi:hypothetical protein